MNIIYKTAGIIVVSLMVSTTYLSAQSSAKDTTLNRQISLEREFTPTLQDASKINTLPAIREPQIRTKESFKFETGLPQFSIDVHPIGDTGAGDINTAIKFDKRKGYAGFLIGNYSNIDGKLGYRILDTKTNRLDIFGRHNSTNGTIDYLQQEYALSSAKAKYADNLLKAKYQYTGKTIIDFGASFFNTGFNYYGNSFGVILPSPYELSKMQNIDVINIEGGAKSNTHDNFTYSANLAFSHFSTKYGPTIDYGGISGNILTINGDISTVLDAEKTIGLKARIDNHSFGQIKFPNVQDAFNGLNAMRVAPYMAFDGGDWLASLGASINYASEDNNAFVFAPEVSASLRFADRNNIYASITGGINENSYLEILQQNRYVDPSSRVRYSRTLYDATIGVKMGLINGLELDLFGGHKHTKDEHFYSAESVGSWGNVGRILYGNLSQGHLGGTLRTSLLPYTQFSAKLVAYFYKVNMQQGGYAQVSNNAWNLPTFNLELNADVKPTDKLMISAHYLYMAGREATRDGFHSIGMRDLNELNLQGQYKLLSWLSVHAKLNNILNGRHEIWYGYTLQGSNAMAGVNLTF